jgi:hypothetical protein
MQKVDNEHTRDIEITAKSIDKCILMETRNLNEWLLERLKGYWLTIVGTEEVDLRSRLTASPAMAAPNL